RNDILRKHGVIPEKPPSPTPMIEEAILEGRRLAHENRLEGKDIDELDELEDLEDETFLEQYRQKRMQELNSLTKKSIHGTVYPISKPEYQREVTEGSNNGPVFVNLMSSMGTNVESRVLSELWKQAAKEYGEIKFCEIRADKAIEDYPDRNCPTILVYKNGDIVKQIVTLVTIGGTRTSLLEIDNLLVEVGAVGEKDMRVVKRRRDAEDAKEERDSHARAHTGNPLLFTVVANLVIFPMAEEPSLPRFPAVSWNSETQSFNNTRKRGRDQGSASALFNNSSDPAIFSSDDDPSLENYTEGRHRKKRYVGSWYQQQPASGDSTFSEEARQKPKMKRTLERQFDSGVWMGSDGSDMEDFGGMELEPATCRLPQLNASRQPATMTAAEEAARDKIFEAIESGDEDIDLTAIGLSQLSNAIIAPLSEFTCIPTVIEGVPFEQNEPALKIYLGANPLTRAPGALFNLEFLTLLSLRNTQIASIPPAIGNLRNLKTLNLSLNRLRWLPAELLDLMTYPSNLKELFIHPNPFYRPATEVKLPPHEDNSDFEESENIILLHESTQQDGARVRLTVARSPVQYMDSRGVVISQFHLPNPQIDLVGFGAREQHPPLIDTEDIALPPPRPYSTQESSSMGNASGVPSLLELALKSCSRTTQLPQLSSYLPADAPPHLDGLFRHIMTQGEMNGNTGDVPCSKCKRRVIMPVARWIEWWDVANVTVRGGYHNTSTDRKGIAVPFMKRACSYKCLPEPVAVGTFFPGTLRWGVERMRRPNSSVEATFE
ncbi:hypothetical protein BJ170DRAFT_585017, partial [Xylariales sp. AK1849]